MRISDWSSDVCSSDLLFARRNGQWGISWGESLRWGKRRGDRIGLSAVTAAGARLGRRYISFGCKGAIGPTHKQPRRYGKDMLFHCHISPARSPSPSQRDRQSVVEGKSVYVSYDSGGD